MNENAEDQVCMMLMLQDGSHYLLDETWVKHRMNIWINCTWMHIFSYSCLSTSEAVSSLKSCLNQLRRSKKLRLEGQLLVTVTTVLLDSDIVVRLEPMLYLLLQHWLLWCNQVLMLFWAYWSGYIYRLCDTVIWNSWGFHWASDEAFLGAYCNWQCPFTSLCAGTKC